MNKIKCALFLLFGLVGIGENSLADTVSTLQQGTVITFQGYEGISEPFSFDIDISAPGTALNLGEALGKPITVTLANNRKQVGIIESIEQVGTSGTQGIYRIKLMPTLAKLKYREASRTFYELNVTDIVSEVIDQSNIDNVSAGSSDRVHEVVLQHRETDLNFVSRLLEAEGFHYHFQQSGARPVISDSNTSFPTLRGSFQFSPNAQTGIFAFARGEKMQSTRIELGDYNWLTPNQQPAAMAQEAKAYGTLRAGLYPSGSFGDSSAQPMVQTLMDQEKSQAQRCYGKSTYAQLTAGHKFRLEGHPRKDFNITYIVTSVRHEKTSKSYSNRFTCQPANVAFKRRLLTPVPTIGGILSGIVTGPAGETKFVDQYGRVKVRFPWRDPSNSADDDFGDAGWVRVLQVASGSGTTALWLPEKGDEVAVAFENGDPGRPVVIGNLFNANDLPPVELPDNKQQTIFQFNSDAGPQMKITANTSAGEESLSLSSGSSIVEIDAAGQRILINSGATSVKMDQAGNDITLQAGSTILKIDGQGIRSNRPIRTP